MTLSALHWWFLNFYLSYLTSSESKTTIVRKQGIWAFERWWFRFLTMSNKTVMNFCSGKVRAIQSRFHYNRNADSILEDFYLVKYQELQFIAFQRYPICGQTLRLHIWCDCVNITSRHSQGRFLWSRKPRPMISAVAGECRYRVTCSTRERLYRRDESNKTHPLPSHIFQR